MTDVFRLILALATIVAITVTFRSWLDLTNPTIAALSYLLIVLITATVSRLWAAITASIVAVLCLNYFFMSPFGTFRIADPQNWVVLTVFLAVATVASSLSTTAHDRTREATARGDQLARLLIERTQLLEDRRAAELARQSEELKSALLASLSHDLRTPLTAIRVAASNLQAAWLSDTDRREQSDLILAEIERLSRLFQNILEMARIDAGAVAADMRWVHPAEIFEAARDLIEHALRQRQLDVVTDSDVLVRLDPRLTASALAHVLENAAQYTPPDTPIAVKMSVSSEGLAVTIRDGGSGISPADLPRVFDRFYRGTAAKPRVSGTGMGLSIARGLLAAERGHISVDNCPDGGAQFTIVVPAESKTAGTADEGA
jgi:two-component system sensor histidine kinase KdpD